MAKWAFAVESPDLPGRSRTGRVVASSRQNFPGVKRDNIDIEISERELRITGEYEEWERVLRRSARHTGHFEYNSLLPTDVKADVNATLSDGVLTVTVPKAQAAKPRHIEIAEP